MNVGLRISVYHRDTSLVVGSLYGDIAPFVSQYTHTITDRFGFESMQCTLTCSLDDALDWLNTGLLRAVIVTGPDAEVVWEGYCSTVSAQIGQKPVSLTLDTMANRVRCIYTTVLGTPGTTATVSDTESQRLYRVKDHIVSLNQSTAADAANRAAVVLADMAFPKSKEATESATGEQGDIQVTLSFTGWYGTLDWVVFSRASTTSTSTTSQVGTLLGTGSPGIGATNAFLNTATTFIQSSGLSATEYVEDGTTYREKIEALLSLGTGTYPLAWGVYEERTFYVTTWAGATPIATVYYERLGDSNIYASNGGIILPWDVRPNAISAVVDLLDVTQQAVAVDAAGRKYVGRVTCSISGDSVGCILETSDLDTPDARLAAMR